MPFFKIGEGLIAISKDMGGTILCHSLYTGVGLYAIS